MAQLFRFASHRQVKMTNASHGPLHIIGGTTASTFATYFFLILNSVLAHQEVMHT